nr:phosphoadenylyl-sulfate reductase [uncultured Desulfuromonas sp.]
MTTSLDLYKHQLLEHDRVEQRLETIVNHLDLTVGFATSLGAEDQIITHLLAQQGAKIRIFTLDTGRLPAESYELLDRTQQRYPKLSIEVHFPRPELVEPMVAQHGINLFYTSVECRRQCCAARKLEPLQRALSGLNGWITGLRRSQSLTREDIEVAEWDEQHGLIKFNPLFDWSEEQVWEFIRQNKVPYNFLHDKGYPSIGCAPCSRAIEKGEDIRQGRWWWENPEHKECGLHNRGAS